MSPLEFTLLYAKAVKEVNQSNDPDKEGTLAMINGVYQDYVDKHYPGKTPEDLARMINVKKRSPWFWPMMYVILLAIAYFINQ